MASMTRPAGAIQDVEETSAATATATATIGGRPHRAQPFIIGVAGGSSSGKSAVCSQIMHRLQDQCVALINLESFFMHDATNGAPVGNVDLPEAINEDEVVECLTRLLHKKAVSMPVFDPVTSRRLPERRPLNGADVVLVEGIMVLHLQRVRQLLSLKVYVDADDDTRLARRIQRDVSVRGRDVGDVILHYTQSVKPAFDQYVAPSRKFADIIIPFGRGENQVAIDLITEHIRLKLQQHELKSVYANLEVIPSNFQTRGMHTIVRDARTSKDEFVFFSDRLLRMVVEAGLGHLPSVDKTVETPTGSEYVGVDYAKKLCGVSIIRSGESMENALRACCKGIKIGKILIHRDRLLGRNSRPATPNPEPAPAPGSGSGPGPCPAPPCHARSSTSSGVVDDGARHPSASGDQEVVYARLPKDIAERYVLLLDPVLSTGHSAARALQVLLEKGVQESRILFLTLVAAPEGITRVCGQYPGVKVITSEIDAGINPDFFVMPGVGDFASRYFCE